jgi:hypothetical protein
MKNPMPLATENKTSFVLDVHHRLTAVYGSGI